MEYTFHPEACAPASGNQKGAVENLVKFVKSNFIMGRSFHDDADLAQQCREWLTHVNTERICDATGQLPVAVLTQEQSHFGKLAEAAQDYGFYDCVIVSRQGLVAIETNRYSVPAHLIGQPLTARITSSCFTTMNWWQAIHAPESSMLALSPQLILKRHSRANRVGG